MRVDKIPPDNALHYSTVNSSVIIPANGKAPAYSLNLVYRLPLDKGSMNRIVPHGENTQRWVVLAAVIESWGIDSEINENSVSFFINSHPGAFDAIWRDYCGQLALFRLDNGIFVEDK